MNTDKHLSPTPYADVNLCLQVLLGYVRTVLGDRFVGMYLYGSLAVGDFDPERSDIDFLVVTSEELPDNLISKLNNMHASLYKSGLEWATRLEAAYIPINVMRKYSPNGPACPLVNKNEFLVARPESHWVINRHILYTNGVVISGPPIRSFIDPVRPEQLREAVRTLLRFNWTPWMNNSDLFQGIEYAQPFVVLTMCRSLCTLKTGTVVSKPRSAEWTIANSDQKWTKLIQHAVAWRHGDPSGDIELTQEFIRHTLKEAGLTEAK